MSQPYSYRPQMNRNVTRKWAEARHVDYDGDDWGADPDDNDDDNDYDEPTQPALSHGGRSFTNPPSINTSHRLSFDQSPEQRVFSASAAGSHSGFPSTSQTGFSQYNRQPTSNAPPQFQSRAPESTGRVSSDSYGRDVPSTDNRSEAMGSRAFPPRKSSLSQQDIPDFDTSQRVQPSAPPPADTKPLPFIRPADIYRRMEEEKEKERRSQDSARPSTEIVQAAARESTPKQSMDETSARTKPNLDTVPERKSEYGMEGIANVSAASQQTTSRDGPSQTSTDIGNAQSPPSASSRYTDKPASIATDSQFPSRNVSQQDSKASSRPAFLPELHRASTFGSDFFAGSSVSGDNFSSVRQPEQRFTTNEKNVATKQESSGPYRALVDNAFQTENTKPDSPARTEDSLLRSNTTSTSQISPIVETSNAPAWTQVQAHNMEQIGEREHDRAAEELVEDLGTPRRLGTNRRDSPSPARRPISMTAPTISEPQSAVLSSPDVESSRNTATEAQILRPGPAVLVHSRGTSSEAVPKSDIASGKSTLDPAPALREQDSSLSEVSDHSNLRSASEEWRDWSNARKEFNAKHGIKDSNPTTPGYDSASMSSPTPPFESLNKNLNTQATYRTDGGANTALGPSNAQPSIRPLATRDESFRPLLPGGWQSSTSIQKTTAADTSTSVEPRPHPVASVTRTDSAESIPTAGAPRQADWRSQYTGPQAQAFAAAAAAGSALAGIFSGPDLSSRGRDSEVSSMDDQYDQPTGRNRDSTLIHKDFASRTPPPPAVPDQYATRDFASMSPPTAHLSQDTPKASQQPFKSAAASSGPAPILTSAPRIGRSSMDGGPTDSPSKESERWWSDDEDHDAHAPAPLRTNRLSKIESKERGSPSVSHVGRHHTDSPDREQLESDIVKSLTPKSSSIDKPGAPDLHYGPRLSPTRTNDNRGGSPPFSAAALAVSPARDYKAIQEQNDFKPLSAPSSKPQSPSLTKPVDVGFGGQAGFGHSKPALATSSMQRSLDEPSNWSGVGANSLATAPTKQSHEFLPRTEAPQNNRTVTDQVMTMPGAFDAPGHGSVDNKYQQQGLGRDVSRSYGAVGENSSSSNSSHSDVDASTKSAMEPPIMTTTNHPATTIPDAGNPAHAIPTTGNPVQELPTSPIKTRELDAQPSTPTSASRPTNLGTSPLGHQTGKLTQPASYDASRSFPSEKVPVEQIFGMGSAQQRIKAYNDNRNAYAEPIGHLENWLTHMNTVEHADAFTALPPKTEYTAPSPRNRRDDGTPSGTKQMQEDGKKLLASASKYGAKAGVLGKGLFSKGKEKLRTVSAGQKGGLPTRKTYNMPDSSRSASTSDNSVPQLPTPTMGTPVDDSAFSSYFPPRESTTTKSQGTRAAVAPPFSPISEVSTNQNELERSTSAVSTEGTPQPDMTTQRDSTRPSTDWNTQHAKIGDRQNFTENIGSKDTERGDRRVFTDRSNLTGGARERGNSSVSDVSSVSDSSIRRQSMAARTISPPIEHQVSRDDSTTVATLPASGLSNPRRVDNQSQHAPSYSTAMASKENEALRERVEDQPLPLYNQAAETKPPRIGPGAQIVPIARLRQDQEVRAEEPRPFSFVGNDSLLHTGHATNQSIDNPGVNVGPSSSSGPASASGNALSNAASVGVIGSQAQAMNNVRGGHQVPSQPSRIVTQDQAEEQYRIPGPYGQELRSPRPKPSSPLPDQYRSPTTPHTSHTQGDVPGSLQTSQRAVTSDYTPFPPQQPHHQGQYGTMPANQYPDSRSELPRNTAQSGPDMAYEDDRYRDRERERDNSRYRSRSRDRSRSSKLSAIFRTRSKSRSRRLQKEKSRPYEQRPDNNRRNSLFKLGNRNSISRDNSYNNAQASSQGHDYDEMPGEPVQNDARPGAGARRLSRDMLRGTTFGLTDKSRGDYTPQDQGYSSKKKRFSGLFGKSPGRYDQYQSDGPARASTLPLEAEQRNVSTPTPNFHNQTTLAYGHGAMPIQGYGGHGGNFGDRSQTDHSLPQDEPIYRPYGQSSDQHDSSNSRGYVHRNDLDERPDQPSAYSNVFPQQPVQSGSLYQHENNADSYGQTLQQQHEQPRPVLPRLDTGDNRSSNVTPVPASAPAVPGSYLQTRENQAVAPVQTQTLPQEPSQQQYHQVSFPQPPSLSQYHQPPTTRAARDISHNSDIHEQNLASLALNPRHHDHGTQQIASPLPMSPSFSESNTLTDTMSSGHTGSYAARSYSQMNQNQPAYSQTMPTYPQPQTTQPGSRITPRVAQLHIRSRSPKLGRKSSEDLDHEFNTANPNLAVNASQSTASRSPVAGLGTFNSKKVSPGDGIPRSSEEQEKPWAITLPADEEEDRRRREDNPDSATSSRAREMKRILLERSPVATSSSTTGLTDQPNQTVADRFISHGAPLQPSRSSDIQAPLPGTTLVAPTSRTGTPTIGRPTTPSVTLRRDASLRGKGPQGRTSTMIDEAGRALVVGAEPQRKTTPVSILGQGSARNSIDINPARSSKDLGQRATIPGTAPGPGVSQRSGSTPPPVPNIPPNVMKDTPTLSHPTSAKQVDLPPTASMSVAPPVAAATTAGTLATAATAAPTIADSEPTAPTETATMPRPLQDTHRDIQTSKPTEVFEMAGSRPEGYESDEEPSMSATAYPGQEWQPIFESWED